MSELCAELLAAPLSTDGLERPAELDERDCRAVYEPLAGMIAERARENAPSRMMVGIAGPPGAGKTTLAAVLGFLLRRMLLPDGAESEQDEAVVVAPLDGFHYPNSYLATHEGVGLDGRRCALAHIKGQCVTFDVEKAARAFTQIREGLEVWLPAYDRRMHDPRPDALRVAAGTRVVIVEGNYLFLDAPPWSGMRDLFDLRVFVTAPESELERRVVARHVRGGSSNEAARERIARVDRPNMRHVSHGRECADAVVEGTAGAMALIT